MSQEIARDEMIAELIQQDIDGVIHEKDKVALDMIGKTMDRNDKRIQEARKLAARLKRLILESHEPEPAPIPYQRQDRIDIGRNEPCPCGSGKKYKKCHLK